MEAARPASTNTFLAAFRGTADPERARRAGHADPVAKRAAGPAGQLSVDGGPFPEHVILTR
jgi:hypothetical protein